MSELLSPAGDKERMEFSFLYGADAVYLGGTRFGLRANATNFTEEELEETINYAHNLGKKVYVTVNIVFHDEELEGLDDYLLFLNKIKVDAIIFSDPIVLVHVRKLNLPLELHLSTQASVLNSKAARFYQQEGVKRIVLAREASREDIKKIKEETKLDIECFIQGAMCTSFSGRCVLSNYATNRDSNRGGCAQICRWHFDTKSDGKFSMMPKDLNNIKNIEDMMQIGVNSFKIEGRMRSIYYIATVVYTYRKVMEKIRTKTLSNAYTLYATNIINRVANRESVSQFYNGLPGVFEQYYSDHKEDSNQDFLGLVKNYENGFIILEVRNYFKVGDIVQIFGPKMSEVEFKIEEIFDELGNKKEICNHPKEIVKIKYDGIVTKNAMMRTKVFDILE